MTSMVRPPRAMISWRSSSVSVSANSSMPLTNAYVMRSPTGSERHSLPAFGSASSAAVLNRSAISSSRSVESLRRLRITSSIRSRSSGSTWS